LPARLLGSGFAIEVVAALIIFRPVLFRHFRLLV
jgi:hypothetical protein